MRLPELFRPIPDAELPHLDPYKKRSATVFSCILFGLALFTQCAETARGTSYPGRAFAVVGVNAIITSLVLVVARRRSLPADLAVLGASVQLLSGITSVGWTARIPHNDFISALGMVPIIVACFVPARPAYSVALGAGTVFCTFVSVKLGVRPPGAVESWIFSIFANTLIAAIAVQLQRRLWHKLEKARAQLAASDRMTVLGRMSAGIAHEMKTPLAAAMNGLESARTLAAELAESIDHPDVESADLLDIAREIAGSVEGATSATKRAARFITAIRSQTLAVSSVDSAEFAVANAITNAVTLVEHARRLSGVTVDTSGVVADLVVESDESKLSQIVTNLVCNALDACANGNGTTVRVSAARLAQGERVRVVVEDDGPGVPDDLRERIFDALFTTKRDAEGTGLGLAISRDIAEGALGGQLVLARSAKGARFELELPIKNHKRNSPVPAWSPAKVAA